MTMVLGGAAARGLDDPEIMKEIRESIARDPDVIRGIRKNMSN